MSETPYDSVHGGASQNSTVNVTIWGTALLITVLFPVAFIFVLRCSRQRSHSRAAVIIGGNPPREEPKLFDVYVKPGLEVEEARLEDILPIAVRTTNTKGNQEQAGSELEESAEVSKTYEVTVLIGMPAVHPRSGGRWDGMGEYTIGTLELTATTPLDNSIHR